MRERGISWLEATLLLLLGMCPCRVAHGNTWQVTYGPDQPTDRIGAVAALAASGDSLLIDPGVYYEHVPLEGKSLTLIGTGGAAATILDGSTEIPGREGAIFYSRSGAPADLNIVGLTLRNGTGARHPRHWDRVVAGGAIFWWEEDWGCTASLIATGCRFEQNVMQYPMRPDVYGGGGIFTEQLGSLELVECEFRGNVSDVCPNDVAISAGNVTILRCSFEIEDWGDASGGKCIDQTWGETTRIEQCTFHAATGSAQYPGLFASVTRLEMLRNQFLDSGGELATCIFITCDYCFGPNRREVLMDGNVFWNAAGPDSAASPKCVIFADGAIPEIRNNTFSRCGIAITNSADGGELVFENNIVARGQARFRVPPGGDYSCNDFWRSWVMDYEGNLTHANNITDNPVFCGEAGGDFTLSEGSPCAPSGGCDLIGAEPVACSLGIHACCVGLECVLVTEEECSNLGGHWMIDPPLTSCEPDPCLTPARKTTWGAMKALFRTETK